jgi:hypothetical protein
MGNQSHPVEPGRQPEASHAWWWGNPPCEALTASAEAVLLSPEIAHPRVALGFATSGAASGTPYSLAAPIPPGSENRA